MTVYPPPPGWQDYLRLAPEWFPPPGHPCQLGRNSCGAESQERPRHRSGIHFAIFFPMLKQGPTENRVVNRPSFKVPLNR